MGYQVRATLEREIKLHVEGKFRFPDLPGEFLPDRVFTSTYFDTPDFRLGQLGFTLRRRVEHAKGLWQLKLPSRSARVELEIPGGPTQIPQTFQDLLFALIHGRDVTPIGKLRTHRMGFLAKVGNHPVAEVVYDSVVLQEGRRILRRFSEIEIELVCTDDTALNRIEHSLRMAGATDGDSRPKIFKALALNFPQQLPLVASSASPSEHLQCMLLRQYQAILLHDPGTRLGKDPEDLHQMRVATRRFRALLRAARPLLIREWAEPLRDAIGWLGKTLGSVRDYDVLLHELNHEALTLAISERSVFERILRTLETKRSIARAALLEALRSDRYLALLERMEKAAHSPEMIQTDCSLPSLAAREFKKLRQAVHDLSSPWSDDALHRVRIQAKRARYSAELAELVEGKPASRFIRQAKGFQDLLGEHQDAVMAEQQLRDLLRHSRGVKGAFAVGRIVERFASRRRRVREDFSRQWTKLNKRGQEAWVHSHTS